MEHVGGTSVTEIAIVARDLLAPAASTAYLVAKNLTHLRIVGETKA
jgi:hypothetical protein